MDIFATLGAACAEEETLFQMFRQGMTGLRIDLTKSLITDQDAGIQAALRAAARAGVTPKLLIDVQGPEVGDQAVSELDRQNLELLHAYPVTGLMQPFVRGLQDLKDVRAALKKTGNEDLRLYAKVESPAGMATMESFIPLADEIVIARGDLGRSMPLYELPQAQKTIAATCRKLGKPFLVVNQLLGSMEQNPTPTRAEVCDIFNCVLDGAVSLLLVKETTAGKYPVECIEYLSKTAHNGETYLQKA